MEVPVMVDGARLKDLVSHSLASGAALFLTDASGSRLVLSETLSFDLLGQLLAHLSGEAVYSSGTWVQRRRGPNTLHLFLATDSCSPYLIREAEKYLTLWLCLIRAEEQVPVVNQQEQES